MSYNYFNWLEEAAFPVLMLFLQKVLIAIFLVALLVSLALMFRWPGVILVPLTYPTIAQAIENSKPHTRIYVDARRGPYYESLLINTENIMIQSLFGRAVINGSSENEPVVTIRSNGVTFAGFEVRGGSTGLLLKNVRLVSLVDNIITKNLQGLSLNQANENFLSHNTIAGNNSIGILIHASNDNQLEGNSVSGHEIGGIFLEENSSNNLLRKNMIQENQTGVRLLSSPRNQFFQNNIWDQQGAGLTAENSEALLLESNYFARNETAIHIANGLRSAINKNRIEKNQTGLILEGNVRDIVISKNEWRENSEFALKNLSQEIVAASENYWGSSGGPRRVPSQPGLGEVVLGNVNVEPWLVEPIN